MIRKKLFWILLNQKIRDKHQCHREEARKILGPQLDESKLCLPENLTISTENHGEVDIPTLLNILDMGHSPRKRRRKECPTASSNMMKDTLRKSPASQIYSRSMWMKKIMSTWWMTISATSPGWKLYTRFSKSSWELIRKHWLKWRRHRKRSLRRRDDQGLGRRMGHCQRLISPLLPSILSILSNMVRKEIYHLS